MAELHTDTFLMKSIKILKQSHSDISRELHTTLKHFEPDPDTVTFLMKAIKKLKHSEPDTGRPPHGHFLNEGY